MNENMEMNNVVEEVVETAKDLVIDNKLDVDVVEMAKTVYKKGVRRGVAGAMGAAGAAAGIYYGGKWVIGKVKEALKNRDKKSDTVEAEFVEEDKEESK